MRNKCWKKIYKAILCWRQEINKLPKKMPYSILLLHSVQILGLYSRFYVQSNTEATTFPIFWNFHSFSYKQFSFSTEQKLARIFVS